MPFRSLICIHLLKVYRVFVWMGSFGADSAKPSILYTNCPWIADLSKMGKWVTMSSLSLVTRNEVNGKMNVYGNKDLKGSQAYPPGFGKALVRLFEKNLCSQMAGASSPTNNKNSKCGF